MVQARIAFDEGRTSSGLGARLAAAVVRIRERREQRRALVKLLSEWDTGIATGARGLAPEAGRPNPWDA